MDFFNFVGAVSGCSAIVGFLAVIVKLGEWKARQEERLSSHGKRIDAMEHKHDVLMVTLNQHSTILAEIKTKIDLICEQKSKRGTK